MFVVLTALNDILAAAVIVISEPSASIFTDDAEKVAAESASNDIVPVTSVVKLPETFTDPSFNDVSENVSP